MVEFARLFHNGSRDSILAAGGLSRRHTRRYCGSERGSTMAARAALSSRQRIRRDPRETVSRRYARLHHGSRKMPIIAADSILQGEGETISRRHERGCLLNGSGRAYHGVARDSVCLLDWKQEIPFLPLLTVKKRATCEN